MTVPVTDAALDRAAKIIKSGGLVAFPTETVYGLGGDAFNPRSLARIFAVKERPFFDPLIIHIAAMEDIERAADTGALGNSARGRFETLASAFWPGPLTMILPKRPELPGLATAGLATAALRFPSHPAARELIRRAGMLAAPSANRFGCLSPTRAAHVEEQIGDRIGMILDGGRTGVGVESTVVDLSGPVPRILRPGGVTREAIEALIGPVAAHSPEAPEGGLPSPGTLKSHYAPRTPLVLFPAPTEIPDDPRAALLFFSGSSRDSWLAAFPGAERRGGRIRALSEAGDSAEAAVNLFDTLHELDSGGFSLIYAEKAPDGGLGEAINDRLSRASQKRRGSAAEGVFI